MQDVVIFGGTIKENLLLGNPSAKTHELGRAVEIADLERLLRRLPKGWDTQIGPGGSALSGGERQLLALARAVLQNPALLLLDESTAELDVAAERAVIQNLNRHFSRQTIVLVSHRISSLRWVDRIVVLNRGVVEEQGSHEQLLRSGGLYSWLYNTPSAVSCARGFSPISTTNP
jgi:ABC-type multidrug transport system fused ATPase/permease subunit